MRPPITSNNDPAKIPAVDTGALKVWMDAGNAANLAGRSYQQRGNPHFAQNCDVIIVANRALPESEAWNAPTFGVPANAAWQYREADSTFNGPGMTGYIESTDAYGDPTTSIRAGRLSIDPAWMPNPNRGCTVYMLFRRNGFAGASLQNVLSTYLGTSGTNFLGLAGGSVAIQTLLPGGTLASGWQDNTHLMRVQVDGGDGAGGGSTSYFYRETGGSVITATTTASLLATYPAASFLTIGRAFNDTQGCPMAFCELIAYEHTRGSGANNRLSRADDLAIRTYLNTKWGLGYTIAADTSLPV